MKRFSKIFAGALAVMMIMCTMMPLMVFACTDCVTVTVQGKDVNKLKGVVSDTAMQSKYNFNASGEFECTGSSGTPVSIIEIDPLGSKITFHAENFEEADKSDRNHALDNFVDVCNEAEITENTAQNINEKFTEADSTVGSAMMGLLLNNVSADLFTAMKWISPMLSFLRVLIGVGCIVIILLLVFSTVMDCVYIGLPMWREHSEKDGGGKPFGVSMEAISTVKEVESDTGGKYKNPYVVYIKRRATTYFVLALCILYLIAGELSGLISGLLAMVEGFTS